MMDAQIIPFIGVAAVMVMTPGPDTVLTLRSVIVHGRAGGIAATLGICSGTMVHATLAALGLSVIITKSTEVYAVIKLIGALYLIYLGVKTVLAARRAGPILSAPDDVKAPAADSFHSAYAAGIFSNLTNPKVAVFYLACLPQFIGAEGSFLLTALLLSAIQILMVLVWLSLVTLLFSRIQVVFMRRRVGQWFQIAAGTVLTAMGLRLATEKTGPS